MWVLTVHLFRALFTPVCSYENEQSWYIKLKITHAICAAVLRLLTVTSVWCCNFSVQTETVKLMWLCVTSKLLLVCTNSRYQLEQCGAAPTSTCCLLLLPDTCSTGFSDLHRHTHTHTRMWAHIQPHKPTLNVHELCMRTPIKMWILWYAGSRVEMQLSFDRRGSLTSQE